MRATIILDGGTREQVTGRTVESIARTRFGRRATVRRRHDDLIDPPTTTWTVMEWVDAANAHSTLGRIVTDNPEPPKRGRGRPRVSDVRIVISIPSVLLAEIDAAAQAAGRSRAEEIRQRCAR